MKKYKSISFEAPQGQSMDDYLKNKNFDFLEFLALGTKKGIVNEEKDNIRKFLIGGEDDEPKVILDNPTNPLQKRVQGNSIQTDPSNNFYQSGPFGPYGNQSTPNYVNSFVQNNPYNPNPQLPPQVSVDNSRRNNNIADFSLVGVQTANNFFNRYYAKQQDLKNQQKFGIENTAQTQYGNRGDYDVNSGMFRPDQYTVSGFKKGGELKKYKRGGEYNVGDKEISDLLNRGYDFDIID